MPNLLSAFRVACVPVLLALAWNGATGTFLALFGLGLVSDVLDGALARRLGLESDFGARLDQWADFALWVSFPLGAWWLWPEIVRREAAYVILAIVCLLLPTAIARRAPPGIAEANLLNSASSVPLTSSSRSRLNRCLTLISLSTLALFLWQALSIISLDYQDAS